MSMHRKKAVEAATASLFEGDVYVGAPDDAGARIEAERAIQAAEPHLQRMYWERFKEAVLSEKGIDAASTSFEEDEWTTGEFPESAMREAVEAALNQAQDLMEGDR